MKNSRFNPAPGEPEAGRLVLHLSSSITVFTIWESLKTPGPPQIGSCGVNTIGVLDFSPTFIIKPYHQKGGTEVPHYDIDKLLFIEFFKIPDFQDIPNNKEAATFSTSAALPEIPPKVRTQDKGNRKVPPHR